MKRFDLERPSADREEKIGVETGGFRGRGREGRWRKVINNLWMESNKRLGEGPVWWTSIQVHSAEGKCAKHCRNDEKQTSKQTGQAKPSDRKSRELEKHEPKIKVPT